MNKSDKLYNARKMTVATQVDVDTYYALKQMCINQKENMSQVVRRILEENVVIPIK